MPVSGVLRSYEIVNTFAAPPQPDGLRVVVREDGRCLDVVASPSSSYLLPDLADFSLVKREAEPAGIKRIMLCGNAVHVEKVSDPDRDRGLRSPSAIGGWGLAAGPVNPMPLVGVLAKLLTSDTFALTGGLAARRAASRRPLAPPVATVASPTRGTHATQPLAPDASVAVIASRISALAGLSDEKLAHLFKVERETFCRWRTGTLANPRTGNRRRLTLLLTLLEDLSDRGVNIRDWLLSHTTADGLTPYELIEQGKIDEAAYLATTIGEPVTARDSRVALGRTDEALEFGDDDVWEPQVLDDDG
jgi:hypothetical protein